MEVTVDKSLTETALIPLLVLCNKLSIPNVTVDGERGVVTGTDEKNSIVLYSEFKFPNFNYKLYISDANKLLKRLKLVFVDSDKEIKTKLIIDETDNLITEIRYSAGRLRTTIHCADLPSTDISANSENGFGEFDTEIVFDKQTIKMIAEGSKTITSVSGVEDKFSLVSTSGKVVVLIKDAVRDTIEIDVDSTSTGTWGFSYDLKTLLNILQLFKDNLLLKIDDNSGLLQVKYGMYEFYFIPHL